MRDRLYNILKLVLCLLFFFFIGNILKFTLNIFGINVDNLSVLKEALFQTIASFIMCIVLFLLYRKRVIKDFKEFINKFGKNIVYVIKMFILFMIVKYVVSFISVFIMILLGFDTSSMTSVNQNLIESYIKTAPILMFLTTSIFAPFYEEILFRLGFKKVFKNKWLFIIISGSLFGLMHVFPLSDGVELLLGITQSISYVTMGIFLSLIYYKTDNIFMSIGVHFLNNFISIITMINMF